MYVTYAYILVGTCRYNNAYEVRDTGPRRIKARYRFGTGSYRLTMECV